MKQADNTTLRTKNRIGPVGEDDKQQLQHYLEPVKALVRLTYESVYVIDYTDMSFEYVSDNPVFLCGHTPEDVLGMGYEFYFKNVPEEDIRMLHTINEAGFDFFEQLPVADKMQYYITYDFHLVNRNGKPLLVNHKLTPLYLSSEGKMWKAICVVSLSHHRQAGNATIHRQGTEQAWKLHMPTATWQKLEKPKPTEKETEVLRLYAQGLTIKQIADRLFVAPDTVKYYRRKIFERFDVRNISEALAYAVNNKII